jgi:Lar family restriction alleviation protein
MGELKPCPFCRGKARVIKENDPDLIQYKIMCQNCGVSTPFIGSREQSEDTWNRRVALESDNTEVLEAYQGLLQKSQELSQMLLEKLKTKNGGGTNESNRNSPQN